MANRYYGQDEFVQDFYPEYIRQYDRITDTPRRKKDVTFIAALEEFARKQGWICWSAMQYPDGRVLGAPIPELNID